MITETLPFTTVVATFNDANPMAPISDYTYVTINWGDGTPATAGTIIQPGGVGTTFEVLGTHTYTDGAFSGNGGSLDFPTTVNVHDMGGSTLTINNSVTVAEINFAISGQLNPASDSGESNSGCDHERHSAEFLRHRHLHSPQRRRLCRRPAPKSSCTRRRCRARPALSR